jgi:cytochrome c oxidase subunit II
VEDEASFQTWLKAQPTFAVTLAAPAAGATGAMAAGAGPVAQGQALAQSKGCAACHTVDGSARVGPTWKGLYGKTETLKDGSTAQVDDAYLQGFIRDPLARGVKGFPAVMPKIELSDEELAALVAYIRSLGGQGAAEQKVQR